MINQKHLFSAVDSLSKKRIFFEDVRGSAKVKNNGVPYVNIGSEVRECKHGPKRKKKEVDNIMLIVKCFHNDLVIGLNTQSKAPVGLFTARHPKKQLLNVV
jgi:hypothetical protein